MHSNFDPQPTLSDGYLTLRPLAPDDLRPLYSVAKDPLIWELHPARDRHEWPVFEPYFATLLATGATLAVTLSGSNQIIGCSRYYGAPDHAESISIGFTFLGRDWWGGQTNRAMKALMLDHAFTCVDRVWLHIGPKNFRSQAATAKIGAVHAYDAELPISDKMELYQCWHIDRETWQASSKGR